MRDLGVGFLDTESIDKSQIIICPGRHGINPFIIKGNPNTNLLAMRPVFDKARGGENQWREVVQSLTIQVLCPPRSNIHGYLFTNVKFWEKVLEAPPPIIE